MKKIYQIYKKLYDLFINKSQKTITTNSNKLLFGISILLNSDGQIDILCELPEINKLKTEDIVVISEKYAELLLYMNKGLFKEQIFTILDNHKKLYDTPQLTLFIDNISSFYKLLNTEFSKIKNRKRTMPLVRPISVFRIQ